MPILEFILIVSGLLAIAAVGAQGADIPRPEHPRPDFQRPLWLNLNGTWQFEIDAENTGEERSLMSGRDLSSTILVPFCPESELSGVGTTDFMPHVWYRRQFTVPESMRGKRLLLHFGAVDWETRVWVNDTLVGGHKGGYTPFCLDITDHVVDGPNELVLQVHDDTASGKQATGKQCHQQESHGCVYTRTTGIWQTVWLEAAGQTWVKDFEVVPDLDTGRALVQVSVSGPSTGRTVRVQALDGETLVAEDIVSAAWRSTHALLQIPEPKAWEPGSPFLYDLKLTVEYDGETLDEVHSYFGMRKVHIEGNRILINNKPIFQRLVLDQGFYPDGIYTAPTDEALKRDVELSMAAGFNGARLHQKVFEPRLLYWADKLGYLIWDEYPSWGVNLGDAEALAQVVTEWQEVLRRDRNHACVIGWCPLNETGPDEGAARAQRLLAVTQMIDPTRPFLDTSGYVHLCPETDVYDSHDYDQNPESFGARFSMFSLSGQNPWNNNPRDPRGKYSGQPFFVSEYGGTRLTLRDADGNAWGYGSSTGTVDEFLARYKALTDVLMDDPNMFGFCYTQLTDIEQEQNGVYYYDRTPKYDPAKLHAINSRPAAYETQGPRLLDLHPRAILKTSREDAQTWRYTFEKPADDWMMPEFDAGAWKQGPGGFGTEETPGAVVGTEWSSEDIWLRREFEVTDTKCELAFLEIHHDEDAEVYVNGQLVASPRGYVQGYVLLAATEALKQTLKPGTNTIAVHCHQTVGGQFIDVGIQAQ